MVKDDLPHSPAQGSQCIDALCCPKDLCDLYITTKPPLYSSDTLPARWQPIVGSSLLCVCVCMCQNPSGRLVREVIRYACVCVHANSHLFVCGSVCAHITEVEQGRAGLGSFIMLIWKVTPSLSVYTLQNLPVVTARQTDHGDREEEEGW